MVVEGVILRLRMTSPHSIFVVAPAANADADGQIQVESHARPLLIRLGLTTEVIKIGARVLVRGHPSKSRPEQRIFALSLQFDDGTAFDLDLDRVLIPLAD